MPTRKHMKVKDALAAEFETTKEENEAFEEMHYRHAIANVASLVVKHGKDNILAEIDAYLARNTSNGD